MQINELNTKKLTEVVLKTSKEPIYLYGISENLLFFKKGKYTHVFDIEENKYLFKCIDGFITSVVDENNNKCFKIIKTKDYYIDSLYPYEMYVHCKNVSSCLYVSQNNLPLLNTFVIGAVPMSSAKNWNCFKNNTARECDRIPIEGIPFDKDISFDLTHSKDFFQDTETKDKEKNFWEYIIHKNRVYYKLKDENNFYRSSKLKSRIDDDWQAHSDIKDGLTITYKDGKYAVVDMNHNIVFNYDENIEYINILSKDYLGLKNKNGQTAIYKLNYGYIVDFDDENKYDHVYMLYNKMGEIFVFATEDQIKFINYNNNTSFTTDFDKIYISAACDAVCYEKENSLYQYDFYTNKQKKLNINPVIKNEDNENVPENIEDILKKYKYYYINDNTNQLTLYKEQKYGIQLQHRNIKSNIKWFDKQQDAYLFEQQILDDILDMAYPKESEVNKNKINTKLKKS